MIIFLFSFAFVLAAYWMLSLKLRQLFYSEWTQKPITTFEYLRGAVPYVLRQFSVQHNHCLGFVDGELKILNQRQSFMLLSFQRLSVLLPIILIAASLQIGIFLSLIVIATLLLMIFFKKPVHLIQLALMTGVFFFLYQWGFYQASQWIYSPEAGDLIFTLSDSRIFSVLGFFFFAIVMTIVIRTEFWSLWFSSMLFFAGGISYLNVFALIVGETLGWSIYWFVTSFKSSPKTRRIQAEFLLLTFLSVIVYFYVLLTLKTLGWLDIRIMDGVTSKKITLLLGWIGWETILTTIISLWGHFRSQMSLVDSSEIQFIQLPKSVFGLGLLGYKAWIVPQLDFRKTEIERRLVALQANESMTLQLPVDLKQKSLLEVESLRTMLGALSK